MQCMLKFKFKSTHVRVIIDSMINQLYISLLRFALIQTYLTEVSCAPGGQIVVYILYSSIKIHSSHTAFRVCT